MKASESAAPQAGSEAFVPQLVPEYAGPAAFVPHFVPEYAGPAAAPDADCRIRVADAVNKEAPAADRRGPSHRSVGSIRQL